MASDGRCDSPGNSAKYGTYTIMDSPTDKVVTFFIAHARNAGNSANIEKKGLIETLNFLENSGIIMKVLVTERHSQIRKYLRENKPQINHQFDIWHMANNLRKKLSNKSR